MGSVYKVFVILLFLALSVGISDSARSRGGGYRARYSSYYYYSSSSGEVNVVGIAIGCSIGGITLIVVAVILVKHYCCSSYGGGCGCYNCERPSCLKCKCRCKKPTFRIKSKPAVSPDKSIIITKKTEDSVKPDPSPFQLVEDSDEEKNYVTLEVVKNGDIRKPARLPPLRNNQIEPAQGTAMNEQNTNNDSNKTEKEKERLSRRQTDSGLNGLLRRQDVSTNGQLNSMDNSPMYPPPPADYIPIARSHGNDNPPPPSYAEAVNDSPKD